MVETLVDQPYLNGQAEDGAKLSKADAPKSIHIHKAVNGMPVITEDQAATVRKRIMAEEMQFLEHRKYIRLCSEQRVGYREQHPVRVNEIRLRGIQSQPFNMRRHLGLQVFRRSGHG